eukprot:822667-Rhodomonas_salina.1
MQAACSAYPAQVLLAYCITLCPPYVMSHTSISLCIILPTASAVLAWSIALRTSYAMSGTEFCARLQSLRYYGLSYADDNKVNLCTLFPSHIRVHGSRFTVHGSRFTVSASKQS